MAANARGMGLSNHLFFQNNYLSFAVSEKLIPSKIFAYKRLDKLNSSVICNGSGPADFLILGTEPIPAVTRNFDFQMSNIDKRISKIRAWQKNEN